MEHIQSILEKFVNCVINKKSPEMSSHCCGSGPFLTLQDIPDPDPTCIRYLLKQVITSKQSTETTPDAKLSENADPDPEQPVSYPEQCANNSPGDNAGNG